MRPIIVITQLTLDGVMQAPGGPDEDPTSQFTHGGWAMPFLDETIQQELDQIMSSEFDLLLGRRTYDIFAAYWPQNDDNSIGRAFNKARKDVATRSLTQLAWNNSQRINGDVVEALRKMKASDGPALHVWGSGQLLQTLIAADLIDEYRLWICPLVLGTGKRLFENGVPPRKLNLMDTRRTEKGVLINTYRPLPKVAPKS